MSNSYNYLPIPPRVWSRVQNQCTYVLDSSYNSVYIPLTNQTVSPTQAIIEDKLIYKGNILQYKGNSAQFTKSQKYSQLARMAGPNRKKVFATQSETYTNPNTTGLQRVNYSTIPFPNTTVGQPNNISGPYQYNVPNPNGCSGTSLQDGGTLVCGTFANPCTGELIRPGAISSRICNPASASDVPGSSILCWNNKVQTWFPKPRYVMNNSTDKWPVNYKGLDGYSGLVSSFTPEVPILIGVSNCENITLSWRLSKSDINNCLPISSYNIYNNGNFVQNVPSTTTSITISISCSDYSFYVTSLSGNIESIPSNIISGRGKVTYSVTSPINTTTTQYINNGYTGIVFDVDASYSDLGPTTGLCTVNFCLNVIANILIIGGGGGGAAGNDSDTIGGGGGGGGGSITYITNYMLPGNTNIQINIGGGGWGRTPGNGGEGNLAASGGANSLLSYSSNLFTSGGGGGGYGIGTTIGRGGGLGGTANNSTGYGGGGGGGAYESGGGQVNNGGSGGSGTPTTISNTGTTGGNASGTSGGAGGASALTTVTLPFTSVPTVLHLGGGGGGGGSQSGGKAGKGSGGDAGTNSGTNYGGANALSGISNSAYGGGGGGGGINSDNTLDIGGNGGNGVVIIWWQSC